MIKFRVQWHGPQGLGMTMLSYTANLEAQVLPRIGEYVRFEDDAGGERSGTVTSVLHYFYDDKVVYTVVVK